MAADLSQIVKAYDVRGVVPDQWDESLAELFGAAFAQVTGAGAIVVGHDMRPSSPGLSRAFARGAAARGVDVTEIGLCSTDQLYYASGAFGLPGAMFTASHNPAKYNGIKMCRAGAAPVGQDTGLTEIRELVEKWLDSSAPEPAQTPGTITQRETLDDYAAYLRSLVDLTSIRTLKVVVDAGNGMGGHTVPTVFAGLPIDLVPCTSSSTARSQPRGQSAGPGEHRRPAEAGARGGRRHRHRLRRRRRPLLRRGRTGRPGLTVRDHGSGRRAGARKNGGRGTVIHNLITSWSVPEVVREHGGTRSAHAWATPSSRRRWRAQARSSAVSTRRTTTSRSSGTRTRACWPPCTCSRRWGPGPAAVAAGRRVRPLCGLRGDQLHGQRPEGPPRGDQAAYQGVEGLELDELDGLTVSAADWWFNVRPSNTEPLLRLNAEAKDEAAMAKIRDEVLAIIRG